MSSEDVAALLGAELRKPKGDMIKTSEALDGKSVLALYFSAHWCPPCRGFTPKLVEKYKVLREAKKDFEMVFVSSDQDEAAFTEYHDEMSFLALPFKERDAKGKLSSMFGVSGIPTLVFYDLKAKKVITTNGRGGISASTFVEDYPYYPKPLNDIGATVDGINSKSSLVVFFRSAPTEEKKKMQAYLTSLATEELKQDEPRVKLFFTADSEGPVNRIRSLCKMKCVIAPHEHDLEKKEKNEGGWGCDGCGCNGGSSPERWRCPKGCDFDYCKDCNEASAKEISEEDKQPDMVILDLANESYYFPAKKEVTEATVKSFVEDFAAKKLTAVKLGGEDE